jgi:hypothetical protein
MENLPHARPKAIQVRKERNRIIPCHGRRTRLPRTGLGLQTVLAALILCSAPLPGQELPREFEIEGGLVLTLWDRWDEIWPSGELEGMDNDLVFGASAHSRTGRLLAELQIEAYADQAVIQAMVSDLDESQLAVLDSALWLGAQGTEITHVIVAWEDAWAETHNGVHQVVASYVRRSQLNGTLTRVHIIRIFNGENSYRVRIFQPLENHPPTLLLQERLVRDVMRNLELRSP